MLARDRRTARPAQSRVGLRRHRAPAWGSSCARRSECRRTAARPSPQRVGHHAQGAPRRRQTGDRRLMGANGRRRVVITGLGAVTPLASGVAASWERLIRSRSAAGAIRAFDASGFPVRFACEAKEFDPTRWIEYKQARRMDRCAQLVVAAARQAESDSGIVIEKESDRVGASVATGNGRPEVLGGLLRHADRAGVRSRQSVLAAGDHPEHGRRLGLDRAWHARARSRRRAPPAPPRRWRSATASMRSGSAAPM